MGFESGWLAKVTFEARTGVLQVVNTIHYQENAGVVAREASLQALADRMVVDVIPKFRGLFESGWQIQPVVVVEEKDPLNPDAVRESRISGPGWAGTRSGLSGDYSPLFHCRVYKLNTGKVGRSFRGRMFVSGSMFELDSAGNDWVAPAASNFAYVADQYVNSIPIEPDLVVGASTAEVEWVVYSPTRRSRDLDDYANRVTEKIPRSQVHSLRSRALYS